MKEIMNPNDTRLEKPEINLEQLRRLRSSIQEIVNILDTVNWSRELSISKTKLQEWKMWLWMQMGNVGWEDLNAKRDEEINKK